jgi:hypothetical protein
MHDLTVHWGWLVGAAIVGLVAGFVLALRAAASAVKPVNDRLLRDSATDRNLLLNVLRRELANWMIRRNPDRYLLVYGKAHTIAAAVSNCTSNERQLRLSLLCIKYPIYQELIYFLRVNMCFIPMHLPEGRTTMSRNTTLISSSFRRS